MPYKPVTLRGYKNRCSAVAKNIAAIILLVFISRICFADTFNTPRPADTAKRQPAYVVNAKRIAFKDSLFRAWGYDTEEGNVWERKSSALVKVEVEQMRQEMIKDGLLANFKGRGWSWNDSILIIDGTAQTQKVSNKYRDIHREYVKELMGSDARDTINRRDMYFLNRITLQLLKDGLIADGDKLSFKLNNAIFMINGKQQDLWIHQKYFREFILIVADDKKTWQIE